MRCLTAISFTGRVSLPLMTARDRCDRYHNVSGRQTLSNAIYDVKSVTLNDLERVTVVTLRYFKEFDKPAFHLLTMLAH